MSIAESPSGSHARAEGDASRLGADSPLVLAQDRAVAAIRFGIGMRRHGYNIFALGPTGAGKHAVVREFFEDQAASEPPARDWFEREVCPIREVVESARRRNASAPRPGWQLGPEFSRRRPHLDISMSGAGRQRLERAAPASD